MPTSTFLVCWLPFSRVMLRTAKSRHRSRPEGIGTARRSRRFTATPIRSSAWELDLRFVCHRRRPISQRVKAWSAVVFPELFGPTKTTEFPSSMSASSNRLKLCRRSFVSIRVCEVQLLASKESLLWQTVHLFEYQLYSASTFVKGERSPVGAERRRIAGARAVRRGRRSHRNGTAASRPGSGRRLPVV